jgi:hypothetical protein
MALPILGHILEYLWRSLQLHLPYPFSVTKSVPLLPKQHTVATVCTLRLNGT